MTKSIGIRSCYRKARCSLGFSTIDLMIAASIMSIMVAAVAPSLLNRPDQVRSQRAKQDIIIIENALRLYRLDNQMFPTTKQSLSALVTKPIESPQPENWASGGYLSSIPVDPWGRRYEYLSPGVHDAYDVFTLGADGKKGGVGTNQDIGSWM